MGVNVHECMWLTVNNVAMPPVWMSVITPMCHIEGGCLSYVWSVDSKHNARTDYKDVKARVKGKSKKRTFEDGGITVCA